jgi:phosphoribosylamine-glycine ligase
VQFDDGACVTVVLASEGYPKSYPKGRVITGIDDAEALDSGEDPNIQLISISDARELGIMPIATGQEK